MGQTLKWFGEDRYEQNLDRVYRFWRREKRYLVSVKCNRTACLRNFDEARFLRLAPSRLKAQASLPGVNLPFVIADMDEPATGQYWGGKNRFDQARKQEATAHKADSLERFLRVTVHPPDDPDLNASKTVRLYHTVRTRLGTDELWLQTPALRGVLDTAEQLLGRKSLLTAMAERPDLIHNLLGKICDFLINYALYLREATGGKLCEDIWLNIFMPAGFGVGITENLMSILSPEVFEEFGIPYLKKISAGLGGLIVHCRGGWGRHAAVLRRSGLPINAVEYHHPFTKIEELECMAGRTAFIPCIELGAQAEFASISQYYDYLLTRTPCNHRYWFAFASETGEAIRYAKSHGF
jgi:hypothetical protein